MRQGEFPSKSLVHQIWGISKLKDTIEVNEKIAIREKSTVWPHHAALQMTLLTHHFVMTAVTC